MKILISHIPNTFNYGSLMMAINVINNIISNSDVEIYVDVRSELDLDRIKKEVNSEKVFINRKNINLSKCKIIRVLEEMKNDFNFYDLRIVLGGDDISEYYTKKRWIFYFAKMYIEYINTKTILLGQTIGPFTGYRKLLARIVLNKCMIYTRDDECYFYLNKLKINNVIKGRDLALYALPMQNEAENILKRYCLDTDEYITIVPSGGIGCYTNDKESYLKEYIKIIDDILEDSRLEKKDIVLLGHGLKPRDCSFIDDVDVINEIIKKRSGKRIKPIRDALLASEAREILGNGLFTISGRMHAAISTFYMRKPAIALSYSVKYKGVIGKGLDMNGLVIEARGNDVWERGGVSKKVKEKVIYILDNYDELINKIDYKVKESSEIVKEEFYMINRYIRQIEESKKS